MEHRFAIRTRVCLDFSDSFRGDLSGAEACHDSGIERFRLAVRLRLGLGSLSVCRSCLFGGTDCMLANIPGDAVESGRRNQEGVI